jgi:hypothetical protein
MARTLEPRWESIQSGLRQLERRDWWLRGTAVVVTSLLTAAVALLILNPLRQTEGSVTASDTKNVAFGLIALVLLFAFSSIYNKS